MQLLFETKTSCQPLPFSRQIRKFFTQTHFQTDARSKQQATARSILGRHRMLRTKRRGSIFFFLMVLPHLVCAEKAALFSCYHWQEPGLRLFILPTAGERQGQEEGEGNQRAKSAGGRWDSDIAGFYTATRGSVVLTLISHHSYTPIWDGYVLQPPCCRHLTEQPKKLQSRLEAPVGFFIASR